MCKKFVKNHNTYTLSTQTHSFESGQKVLHVVIIFQMDAKPALTNVPKEHLRSLFNVFDVERTGSVDSRELKAALRALGVAATAEQVKQLIAANPRTTHNAIAFEDFCAIVESRLPMRDSEEALRQTFTLLGGGETGYLSLGHLRQACDEVSEKISDVELQQMISAADRDGDGYVSFPEFARIMRQRLDAFEDDE